jgi:hypothetical protein
MDVAWLICFGRRQELILPGFTWAFVWKYLKKIAQTTVSKACEEEI